MQPHMTWAYLLVTVHIRLHAAYFLEISWEQKTSFKNVQLLNLLIREQLLIYSHYFKHFQYQLICKS